MGLTALLAHALHTGVGLVPWRSLCPQLQSQQPPPSPWLTPPVLTCTHFAPHLGLHRIWDLLVLTHPVHLTGTHCTASGGLPCALREKGILESIPLSIPALIPQLETSLCVSILL